MADERAQAKRIGRDLTRFIGQATGTLVVDVLDELIAATPVDTGYGRASWRPSIGQPDFREGRRGAAGVSAATRDQKAGRTKAASLQKPAKVFITGTGYLVTVDEKRPFVREAIRSGIDKTTRRRLRPR